MTTKGMAMTGCLQRRGGLAVTTAIVAIAVAATAQAQQIPRSFEPGRLEQRFEQLPQPESKPPVEFPAPEQAPPPDKAGQVRFTLQGIQIQGATVYAESQLRPFYEKLLGREVSLLDIYQVRDAITAKYRGDGYILSQALIPAQRIQSGIVRIEIVEGHVNSIEFQGELRGRMGLLDEYADKIKASRPLKADDLERYVLLADDLPGVTVKTVLSPSKGDKAGSDLVFILEQKPVGAGLTVDNRGTRAVGRYQFDGRTEFNNLAGLFEQTAVRGIVTQQVRELQYLDVTHTETLDSEGTTSFVGARRSWSKPGDTLSVFEMASVQSTLRFGVSHPFIRSRAETLRGDLDFTVRNSRSRSFGILLSEDRTRPLTAGLTYDFADSLQGSNLIQTQASYGLNVFNATRTGTPNLSRADARSDFRKLTLLAERNQPLPEQFAVRLAAQGQYSPDKLLSSEEFGLGGSAYGRAFDSSEITGDNGLAGTLELQYTPIVEQFGFDYVQFYTFSDIGAVWNYEDGPRHGRQSLASAGGGIRLALANAFNVNLELAKPFIRNAGEDQSKGWRAFFSLSARY